VAGERPERRKTPKRRGGEDKVKKSQSKKGEGKTPSVEVYENRFGMEELYEIEYE